MGVVLGVVLVGVGVGEDVRMAGLVVRRRLGEGAVLVGLRVGRTVWLFLGMGRVRRRGRFRRGGLLRRMVLVVGFDLGVDLRHG